MDPEQTFLRVHARLSGMLLRVLTPKIRTALEYLHFAVAVALFCSLIVMHTNFVQQVRFLNFLVYLFFLLIEFFESGNVMQIFFKIFVGCFLL